MARAGDRGRDRGLSDAPPRHRDPHRSTRPRRAAISGRRRRIWCSCRSPTAISARRLQRGRRWGSGGPSLRLANLARLRHPMSVDLYLERVVAHARCVVIRLLGALEYWRYGAEEIAAAVPARGDRAGDRAGRRARRRSARGAVDRVARRCWRASTRYLREGGAANLRPVRCMLAAHLGGIGRR